MAAITGQKKGARALLYLNDVVLVFPGDVERELRVGQVHGQNAVELGGGGRHGQVAQSAVLAEEAHRFAVQRDVTLQEVDVIRGSMQ